MYLSKCDSMTLGEREQEMKLKQISTLQRKQALLDCWLIEGKEGIIVFFRNTGDNNEQNTVSETEEKEKVQERSWKKDH